MKNEITITIAGKAMTGKSRISYLIKEFLRTKGFLVDIEVGMDFSSEADFNKRMGRNLNEAINAIQQNSIINIHETQLTRNGSNNKK